MELSILVENIKCGGCANGIKNKLVEGGLAASVDVDVEQGRVDCTLNDWHDSQTVEQDIKDKLLSMGYPEQGSVEGLKAAGAKAKSYVSCAVGKMSATDDDK